MLTRTPPGGHSPEGDSSSTGPPTAERRPQAKGGVPDNDTAASVPPGADTGPDELASVAQLKARREAADRLPVLESGYRDPLLRRAAS